MQGARTVARREGRRLVTFKSVTISLLVILTSLTGYVGKVDALCAQQHWGECIYTWGYSGNNGLGWLAPSNTTLYTPLVTNASITNWMQGEVTIFPFQVEPHTSATVGLYANGALIDSFTTGNLSVSSAVGYGGSCVAGKCESLMLKSISPSIANFSDWTWEVGLYHQLSWLSPIASGSVVALAFEVSKPVWVSVANQSSGTTYEETHASFVPLPETFPSTSEQSPHTVAAWIWSPNQNAPTGVGGAPWLPLAFLVLPFALVLTVIVAILVVLRVSRRRSPDRRGLGHARIRFSRVPGPIGADGARFYPIGLG